MPGVKRPLDEGDHNVGAHVHPARKRRVEHSEANARLANIYNDLADDVQAVRLKAAGELLKSLSVKSPDRRDRIDASLTRLVKGLCSGRKAARVGFSIALPEVLRFAGSLGFDLRSVTERIVELTQPESKASGREKREYLLGRRFAFSAILQSNLGTASTTTAADWKSFFDAVLNLASQKPWLRRECGSLLYDWMVRTDANTPEPAQVQVLVDSLSGNSLWKVPEGVALWLTAAEASPAVELPKGIWHHRDPLHSKERPTLSKVMREATTEDEETQANGKVFKSGARQIAPSFAWKVVLSELYRRDDGKGFPKFWADVVDRGMFSSSSSAERKFLGLLLLSLAIATAPVELLRLVASPNALRCIINQRADPERSLFEAAKAPLNRMIIRAETEPRAAAELLSGLLADGTMNFDQLTKTKTTENLIANLYDEEIKVVFHLRRMISQPSRDPTEAESRRKMIADMLLTMVRTHREPNKFYIDGTAATRESHGLAEWLRMLLETLAECTYRDPKPAPIPALSESAKAVFRARLMSCLGHLLNFSIEQSVLAPTAVVASLTSPGTHDHRGDSKLSGILLKASRIHDLLREKTAAADRNATPAVVYAFQLLFAMSILQVYGCEPDGILVLEDLISCYESRESIEESSSMLIELLLSFVSKPSALFRKLAEQVFAAFANDLTTDGLQSMLNILQQKENLSGQQELFDQNDSDDESTDESGSEVEDEVVDVEEDSDIELVSREMANASTSENEGSEENDDDNQAATGGEQGDEDEEAAFDRKLAAALGTAAADEDEGSDDSNMDDEQMMALEPHLANIFKERKKSSSKKQDNKDAKENIVNFKNRVLDLLSIYVKSRHTSALALDIILPLTKLVRTTTSKPTADKAFAVLKQYFEACNKSKTLPHLEDAEPYFAILTDLHAEMKPGGSKLHANACSRSSLFLAKVLVNMDMAHFARISQMYAELLTEKFTNPGSKIQGSVFTEWTSWCIAPRKAAAQVVRVVGV